jgi:hypothetical protein
MFLLKIFLQLFDTEYSVQKLKITSLIRNQKH